MIRRQKDLDEKSMTALAIHGSTNTGQHLRHGLLLWHILRLPPIDFTVINRLEDGHLFCRQLRLFLVTLQRRVPYLEELVTIFHTTKKRVPTGFIAGRPTAEELLQPEELAWGCFDLLPTVS